MLAEDLSQLPRQSKEREDFCTNENALLIHFLCCLLSQRCLAGLQVILLPVVHQGKPARKCY